MFSLNYLYNGTIVFVPLPCDKIFPEETQHKCLLNPDLVIYHRLKDKTTEVQLEWVSLGLLTGIWVRNYRSRNDSTTDASQSPHQPGWQLTNLGTWSTTLRKVHQVGECPFLLTLPGILAGFFQVVGLFSESSLQFHFTLFERNSQLLLLYSGWEGLVNLFSFRDFLKFFWVIYFPV